MFYHINYYKQLMYFYIILPGTCKDNITCIVYYLNNTVFRIQLVLHPSCKNVHYYLKYVYADRLYINYTQCVIIIPDSAGDYIFVSFVCLFVCLSG